MSGSTKFEVKRTLFTFLFLNRYSVRITFFHRYLSKLVDYSDIYLCTLISQYNKSNSMDVDCIHKFIGKDSDKVWPTYEQYSIEFLCLDLLFEIELTQLSSQ